MPEKVVLKFADFGNGRTKNCFGDVANRFET